VIKKLLPPLLLLFSILIGCQSQSNVNANEDKLYTDAQEVFEAIKSYDDSAHDKIEEFKATYINNVDDYESQRDLLVSMDKLTGAYIMYNTSVGLDDKEAMKQYQDVMDTTLSSLEETFNN